MDETASYVSLPTFYWRLADKYAGMPHYQRLWKAVIARKLPGRQVGGRWQVREDAEQAAVALFGLTRCQVAA